MILEHMTAVANQMTHQFLEAEFKFEQNCNRKEPKNSPAGSQAHCTLIKEEGCYAGTCKGNMLCSPADERAI